MSTMMLDELGWAEVVGSDPKDLKRSKEEPMRFAMSTKTDGAERVTSAPYDNCICLAGYHTIVSVHTTWYHIMVPGSWYHTKDHTVFRVFEATFF
mgnify:CR=1 FL=1